MRRRTLAPFSRNREGAFREEGQRWPGTTSYSPGFADTPGRVFVAHSLR